MECKCYKKATIWIVFIHYLAPRKLTKDLKGKKRKNESRTKMESVYLLLFVSTNFVTSIFLLVEKYFTIFCPLVLHIQKYKTSPFAGGFVLFCIEIKLSAKVEGGFPRLWPSKFFRCEFRKWLKTASAGSAHLKLCLMQMRCNRQKRAD